MRTSRTQGAAYSFCLAKPGASAIRYEKKLKVIELRR
jgi:hypothetical protein